MKVKVQCPGITFPTLFQTRGIFILCFFLAVAQWEFTSSLESHYCIISYKRCEGGWRLSASAAVCSSEPLLNVLRKPFPTSASSCCLSDVREKLNSRGDTRGKATEIQCKSLEVMVELQGNAWMHQITGTDVVWCPGAATRLPSPSRSRAHFLLSKLILLNFTTSRDPSCLINTECLMFLPSCLKYILT